MHKASPLFPSFSERASRVSSSVIALSLLTNDASTMLSGISKGAASAPKLQPAVAGDSSTAVGFRYEHGDTLNTSEDREFQMGLAVSIRMAEMGTRLRMGDVGPFDAEAADVLGGDHIWAQTNSDPRLAFEGMFGTSEQQPWGRPHRSVTLTSPRAVTPWRRLPTSASF